MEVNSNLKKAYHQQESNAKNLSAFQQENWKSFSGWGIPSLKHEEWKYAQIKNIFKDEMQISTEESHFNDQLIEKYAIPGTENFNRIVFFNGRFQIDQSIIHEKDSLIIKSLEIAAGDEDAEFVETNLGHSQGYHPDGINALNASFAAGGVFIKVKKNKVLNQPLIIYHYLGQFQRIQIFSAQNTCIY